LGALAAIVYMSFQHASPGTEPSHPTGAAQRPASINNGTDVLVRAYEISAASNTTPSNYTLSGTLQPRYLSQLGFRIAGKIIERHVEVGDRVTQGQILFRLDPIDSQLQLQMAESDLVAAQSQLQLVEAEERRLADLKRTNSTSQSDYDIALSARDTARARLDAAERRLKLTRNQLEYCELSADQDGLVVKLQAEVGQVVSLGQPVLQWVQGDELEAVVSIPESLLDEVQHSRAEISFWSLPDQRVVGQLREISPIADPVSRTYDARFRLNDRLQGLALGMTATVHLLHARQDGIRLPMSAIANTGERPVVWKILDDGHVASVPIEILKYETDSALVRSQLLPGDRIVAAGVQRIDDQCRVRIWQDRL
jgi:RND family efflux transporter MFP subunit